MLRALAKKVDFLRIQINPVGKRTQCDRVKSIMESRNRSDANEVERIRTFLVPLRCIGFYASIQKLRVLV